MAIYHTRVKMFSRSKGHSAIAAAAYRAGIRLIDNTTGQQHDYSRRRGVLVTRCFSPLGAPAWTVDPQQLWQKVHVREKRKDSQLAREFEIALPHELSDEQRCELAWDICRDLTNRYDFAMQASIHEPPVTDGMNWHLHALATTRRIRDDALQDKTKELDGGPSGKAEVEWIREMVSKRTNQHLAAAGIDVRIDHRSLGDQLLAALDAGDLEKATELASREPTKPLGKRAVARLRRGMDCELADANAAIRRRNARRFMALRQQLVDDGQLPPAGHSHNQALRDREREAGQALILGSSGAIGTIEGLGRTDDRRTPEQRRDAKQ